ncbi:quinate permease [Colletotrichum simmondsii]|uniref:Quinate permease n=1 Tax=Colletotrichum simmondsii TaxID=703756 RepID=A0A135TZT8_9PEZI|nr:quinate permease [Colletotrichum simmondsii]
MGFNLHADGTNDPSEVRNWRIHMIAVIASMSAIAMGYDTSVIGGTMALDSFRRDFDLADSSPTVRDTLQGNIVSTFQAGCFFGALLMFPLAEWLGRKRAIMISALVFLVGGTLMTASHGEIGLLIAGRAIAGLGIGATSLIVPVYISEISPPSIRGRLVGLFEIASQGGGMCGFWVNYAVDRTISDSTQTQWIVPLGLQLLPGVLLFFGIFLCPESPRWLAKNDRWEDATRVLVHVRELPADHDYVSTEISDIRRQVEDSSANRMTKSQMFKRLFEKGSRNRIGIGLLLMACQNLTGVNIITYYSPRIFETLGITGTSTKLFATGFYGIAKTLGMVIFTVWLAEKVGRRNGLIWGAFVGSLPMWYIGGFTFLADPAGQAAAGNTDRNAWGYIAMVCVYLYGLIYCATWQGITWLYCSEVFSLDIRMLCVAITTADQWLWSFIVSRTTPYMITSLGYGTYMFFGALMILMGVWAFFFVPETKATFSVVVVLVADAGAPVLGLTLEDMDLLFMRSMHTTVWTALRERKSVKDVLADTSPAAIYATGSEEKEIRLKYVDTVEVKSVAR